MSNTELFLSSNNLKENFQTVADEILKTTGYNISRHQSLETKFNSMATIIISKTPDEERTLGILNTKLQMNSVTYFQKVIQTNNKKKGARNNIQHNLNTTLNNTPNTINDFNQTLDLPNNGPKMNQQMDQLMNSRRQLNDRGNDSTDAYMPRPINPSDGYINTNQRSKELEDLYKSHSTEINNTELDTNTESGYNIQPFTISSDVFNTINFDDEKDLPLYQNISTLQDTENSNPMELMNRAEQSRKQELNNYKQMEMGQKQTAQSIITQGQRDIVLERNNTDAVTKIDQTIVDPKLLHQKNEEWQNRMLKNIDNSMVNDNIVSNLDKTLDALLQDKLIKLQRDAQPDYQDRISYISVNSIDRKWESDDTETRYDFQVKFNPSSDFTGAGINNSYKNVLSVELVSAILPVDTHIEPFDTRIYLNIMKYPYLLLSIEELEGVFSGTNMNNDKAFATLVFDKFHNSEILSSDLLSSNVSVSTGKISYSNEFKRGFIRYNPAYFEKKRFYNAPLASLNKLSIHLTDPRGNAFNTLSDTNTINDLVFSDDLDTIASTLELTASNGFPNTSSGSHKMIKLTSTKHFSNRMFRIGDRILIKNYSITGSGGNNSKFINFINREEGHIIINLEQEIVTTNKGQINIMYLSPPGVLDSNKEVLDTSTYYDSGADTGTYTGDSASFVNVDLQSHFLFRIVTREVDVSNVTKPINV